MGIGYFYYIPLTINNLSKDYTNIKTLEINNLGMMVIRKCKVWRQGKVTFNHVFLCVTICIYYLFYKLKSWIEVVNKSDDLTGNQS